MNLNVGSVHWLAPKSQVVAKQLCGGEVWSPKCVHVGNPYHVFQPPPSPLQPNVVARKNVQVGSKGANRKGLAFEKHALQQKVSLYAKWFHWILSEFTSCSELGPMKK